MTRHFTAEGTIRESQISPLSCGVRRLFICVIKLKDIILEIKKGTKLPLHEELEPLLVSKREEAEAVDYLKKRVIPEVADTFNKVYPHNYLIGKGGEWVKRDTGLRIQPSDISQALKKTRQRMGYEYDKNIEVITYSSDIQLTQRVKGNNRHHLFEFYIYKDRPTKKIKIEVNFHLSSMGNRRFVLNAPLAESKLDHESPEHLRVSKREEAQALDFIKRVSIPYAVKFWNKSSPRHWDLTDDGLRQILKKVGHSHGGGGDMIIYKTQFHPEGTRPHEFVFTIMKSDLVNKLTVVVQLNLHRAGDRDWDVNNLTPE